MLPASGHLSHSSTRPHCIQGLASIIIPTCNNLALTRDCLAALQQHTAAGACEIIVVDNGSTGGTPEFLHHMQERGLIRVILSPQNLGFAKACNQGARAARGEFLVFLNNDTVVTPGWLQELVSSARENPRVATVGAKLLYPDDTVQHAGVTINDERKFFHLYEYFHKDHPASQCLTAACLLVKNEKFFQLGGFDEQFHYGWEDMDLCPRFRKQDWQFLYNPRSVIYHLESKTPGRFNKEAENSELLFSRWHHLMVPDTDHYLCEDGIMRPPNYDYTQGGNWGQGRQKVSEARKVVLTLRRQEKGRFQKNRPFIFLCVSAP